MNADYAQGGQDLVDCLRSVDAIVLVLHAPVTTEYAILDAAVSAGTWILDIASHCISKISLLVPKCETLLSDIIRL